MNRHVHEMDSLFVMKKLDDGGIFFSESIHIRRIILKSRQTNTTIPSLTNDESEYIHRVNLTAETTSRFDAYFARVSQNSVLAFVDDQLSLLHTDVGAFVFSKRLHVLDEHTVYLLTHRPYSAADLDIVLDLYMEDSAGGYFSTQVVADTIRARETPRHDVRKAHRTEGEGLRTRDPMWNPSLLTAPSGPHAMVAAAAGGGVRRGGASASDAASGSSSGRPAYTTEWRVNDAVADEYCIFYHYQDPIVRMSCEYVVMTLAEYLESSGGVLQKSVEDWFQTLVTHEATKFCSYGKGDVNCCTKVMLDWLKLNIGIHESLSHTYEHDDRYQELLADPDYAQFGDVSDQPRFNSLFVNPEMHVPIASSLRGNPFSKLLTYLQQIINRLLATRRVKYPPISILEVLDTTNMSWIIRCEQFHLAKEPCYHHGLHGTDASDRLLKVWGLPKDQYASHVAIHTIAHAIDRIYCGHEHSYTEAGTRDQILGQIFGSLTFFASCKNRFEPKTDGSLWTAEELWKLANQGLFDDSYGYDEDGRVKPECTAQKSDHGCEPIIARPSSLQYDHALVDRQRQERRTARGYFNAHGEDAIGDRCEVHEDRPPMCLLKNRAGRPYWLSYAMDYQYPFGCEKNNSCIDPCDKNATTEVGNEQRQKQSYIKKCKSYTFKPDVRIP
jgi:hypothetical protein